MKDGPSARSRRYPIGSLEDLSPSVREQIFELTKPEEAGSAAIECSENLIRHYCEALEDGNPLYLDSEYARANGFSDIVAQPGMLVGTLATPYRFPWPPEGWSPGGNAHYKLKKLMNLPVGVVVDNEVEFLVSSRSAIACFARRDSRRSPDRRRRASAKAGSGSSRRASRIRGARSSAG